MTVFIAVCEGILYIEMTTLADGFLTAHVAFQFCHGLAHPLF